MANTNTKRKFEVVIGFEVEAENYIDLVLATGTASREAQNHIKDAGTVLSVLGVSVNPKKEEVRK